MRITAGLRTRQFNGGRHRSGENGRCIRSFSSFFKKKLPLRFQPFKKKKERVTDGLNVQTAEVIVWKTVRQTEEWEKEKFCRVHSKSSLWENLLVNPMVQNIWTLITIIYKKQTCRRVVVFTRPLKHWTRRENDFLHFLFHFCVLKNVAVVREAKLVVASSLV